MCIPPLMENNIFVTNFQDKAVIFNDLFCEAMFPYSERKPDSRITAQKTQSNLSRIEVQFDKIVKMINHLNCSKANGYDDISIRMLKLFAYECSIPLNLLGDMCLETGHYPAVWKMANFIGGVTVRFKLTTDQYLSFQYVAKILKESLSMKSTNTCLKIILFPLINLAFVLGTLLSISSCQ